MTANENGFDRIVRLVLGAALIAAAWFYLGGFGSVLAIIVGVVGLILVATSAIGWCPLYAIFGISTCRVKS